MLAATAVSAWKIYLDRTKKFFFALDDQRFSRRSRRAEIV